MVNVISGPSQTEIIAMACSLKITHKEHCIENRAASCHITLAKGQHWHRQGNKAPGGYLWEPVGCGQAHLLCLGIDSLGRAAWTVYIRVRLGWFGAGRFEKAIEAVICLLGRRMV
jgi:hypothetical protein